MNKDDGIVSDILSTYYNFFTAQNVDKNGLLSKRTIN